MFESVTRVSATLARLGVVLALCNPCAASETAEVGPTPGTCQWDPAGPLEIPPTTQACAPVVHDQTATWEPWTYRPWCAPSTKPNGPKYCAFTYSPFRGGQSFSLATTPEIAADFAARLQDPDPRWLSWRGTNPLEYIEQPYAIVELPGKGLGGVANRTIRRGEVILREFPVLADLMKNVPGIQQTPSRAVLERAFEQLHPSQQSRMLEMAYHSGEHLLEDIIQTNNFGVMLGTDDHAGLFPETAVRPWLGSSWTSADVVNSD